MKLPLALFTAALILFSFPFRSEAQDLYDVEIRIIRVVEGTTEFEEHILESLFEDSVALVDHITIRMVQSSQEKLFTNAKPFRYVEYSPNGEPLKNSTRELGLRGSVLITPINERHWDVSLKHDLIERRVPAIRGRGASQFIMHRFLTITEKLSFQAETHKWHFSVRPTSEDLHVLVTGFRITPNKAEVPSSE